MDNKELIKIRMLLELLVKNKISKNLKSLSSKEKEIYDLTGKIGQNEIIKKVKMSSKTISKIWQKLEKEGILIKDGKGYRKVI